MSASHIAVLLVACFALVAGDEIDLDLIAQQFGIDWCGPDNFEYSSTGKDTDIAKCVNGQWNPDGPGDHPLCIGQKTELLDSIHWGDHNVEEDKPEVIYSKCYHNGNSQPMNEKFSRTEKYTDKFATTTTTSVKGTVSLTIEAGIPEFVNIKESFSLEVSVTDSQTKESTKEIDVSDEQDITVDPDTTVKADLIIYASKYNAQYSVDVKFVGSAAVKCKEKKDDHYLWYPSAKQLMEFAGKGCSFDGDDAICAVDGKFEGVAGGRVSIDVNKVDSCDGSLEMVEIKPKNATKVKTSSRIAAAPKMKM